MRNLIAGLKDYLRGQRLLFREGLWPLFLVPGILSLCYLPLSFAVGIFFLGDFTTYVHEQWIPDFLKSTLTLIVLGFFLAIVALVLGFALFRNVIMILYSPILGYLSEAVELHADPREGEAKAPRFSWGDILRSAGRGTMMSLLTFLFAMLGLAGSFLIGLIPIVGALAGAVFLPVFTIFLAGMGFCDPPLDRRGYGIGGSVGFAWRNRGRVIGHGLGFTLLLLIPVVGWFVAPSYGVVAGTLGAVDILGRGAESLPTGRSDASA